MSHASRLPLFQIAQPQLKNMIALSRSLNESGLGLHLVELIKLRISQVNGCGFCVDMHWRAMVRDGADARHLNSLSGWRESPFFSARERAALGWAEAVNALPQKDDTEAAFAAVREHFSDDQIGQIGYTVAVIRGWNMLNLSLRTQIPEVPAPGM